MTYKVYKVFNKSFADKKHFKFCSLFLLKGLRWDLLYSLYSGVLSFYLRVSTSI